MNDYDPVGGHTKEEADAAFEALFRELHGEEAGETSGNHPTDASGGGSGASAGDGTDGGEEDTRRRVYIVGHKNPDTDSICASIAYARLKNQTDPSRVYLPKRAGTLNEETQFVLEAVGAKSPELVSDVRTQVSDIDIRHLPGVDKGMTIRRAWKLMKEGSIVTLPITEPLSHGERLIGLVTVKDLGRIFMDNTDSTVLADAGTTFGNIAEVLKGEIVVGDGHTLTTGKTLVAAANSDRLPEYIDAGDMVIVSNRGESQLTAIESGAGGIIITMDAPVAEWVKDLAEKKGCTVISTGYDTFTAATMIKESVPLSYVMNSEGIVHFHPDDYLADLKKTMGRYKHRDFPIQTEDGAYIGMISRRFLLDPMRKQVILVDHNEKSQAVDGIDEAEILEIVDHHRLGSLETIQPIYFRNQPVGSTSTIIAQLYRERDIQPDKISAGLLCSGIISDTLLFTSPTTTPADKIAAVEMANIAGIDMTAFATSMFHAGSAGEDKSGEELFHTDYKSFTVDQTKIGIGQINVMDRESVAGVKAKLADYLEEGRKSTGQDMVFFMVTNIADKYSEILFAGKGAEDLLSDAFEKQIEGDSLLLEGVVSRKKQLAPELIGALQG
jgi:manganese-dependent inorganic pyrophosphatase